MSKVTRIPRKLKKQLKKKKLYDECGSIIHCILCQKRLNGWGYDMLFCLKCENENN